MPYPCTLPGNRLNSRKISCDPKTDKKIFLQPLIEKVNCCAAQIGIDKIQCSIFGNCNIIRVKKARSDAVFSGFPKDFCSKYNLVIIQIIHLAGMNLLVQAKITRLARLGDAAANGL